MSNAKSINNLDNSSKWQSQPYVSWKDNKNVKYAATPKWSRPATNNDPTVSEVGGNAAIGKSPNWWPKARPIKHWRKQLQANNNEGISRSSYSIQYNTPGSSTFTDKSTAYQSNSCSEDNETSNSIYKNFNENKTYQNDAVIIYENNQKKCISCDPISNRIKPTLGMNTKLINPTGCTNTNTVNSSNTPVYTCKSPQKKYYFNRAQYLKSKNKLYSQNLSGSVIEGVKYTNTSQNCCISPIPYNNSKTYDPDVSQLGSQVRQSLSESTCCDDNKKCLNIVVKPNNRTFFQQGAVSSSSRIERLKYNTVQSNINSISNSWGKAAGHASQYNGTNTAPFILKSKNNVCYKPLYHRQGNKTVCFKLNGLTN